MLGLSILLKSSTLKSKYSIKITSELFPTEDSIQLRFVCESKPYQYFPQMFFVGKAFSGFNVWLFFLSFWVKHNSRKTISIFLMPSSSRLVFLRVIWWKARNNIQWHNKIIWRGNSTTCGAKADAEIGRNSRRSLFAMTRLSWEKFA